MSLKSVDDILQSIDLERRLTVPSSVTVPDRPDSTIPAMIHRHSDGWVSFGRKGAAGWEPLGNWKAADINGLFRDQTFQEAVDQDAYFSLNTFHGSDRIKKPNPHKLEQLAPALRNVPALRHLTSCWVDLDGYNANLDKHDLYASVMRRAERGEIPVPSLFTVSRGVWAVWLLRDRVNPDEPVRDFPHHQVYSWWLRLQRTLHERLADIGSDKGSQDGARMTRIPGTINRKGGQRVGYMVPLGPDQRPFTYTLDELDAFLKPAGSVKQLQFRSSVPAEGNVRRNKQRGFRSRFEWLIKRLEWLRMARHGWSVGHRDLAMLYLAIALKGAGWSLERVEATFRDHLDDMAQPVNDRITMRNCLNKYEKASFKEGGVSNQTVADALCVTPAEASELSRKDHPFPAASQFPADEPETRADRQEARRQFIERTWQMAKQHGQTLTGSDMLERVRGHGMSGSLRTILKDMRQLGLIPKAQPVKSRQLTLIDNQ